MLEIVHQGLTHLEPSIISKMKHTAALCFTPMFPPVVPYDSLMELPINIKPVPGVFPNSVGVEAGIVRHLVGHIQNMNLMVYPINLFFLIDIPRVGKFPIVWEPS